MELTLVLKTAKQKDWLKNMIPYVRMFRTKLDVLQKENINPGGNKELMHIQRKIEKFALTGERLGFTAEQIKQLNLLVSQKTQKGESSDQIYKSFL